MIPIIGFSLIVQVACAVHCVRGGRNQLWLTVIILFSLPGCFAYALFEILPGLTARREVRTAQGAVVRKLDPERELRAAREALETADTAANRIALADRLAELQRWAEAVPEYEAGIAKAPGAQHGARLRLASAAFEAGDTAKARSVLEALPETGSRLEEARSRLLMARVLEEQGETARALALYHELGDRLPGAEPQCRQAALLMRLGRNEEARALLEEVEWRVKRLSRHERGQQREMYDWAARTLAELRDS
jgi:hypothetical protein